MPKKIIVLDPTANDNATKVRGVGRYLQILRENLPKETEFLNSFSSINQFRDQTILIHPFFNFLKYPISMKKIAQKQIAVIHDLIPLKYPQYFPVGIKGRLNIFLNKLALKNYDLVVTDSQTSEKDIVRILGINKNKVKVIYPCLPKVFNNSDAMAIVSNSPKNKIFKYHFLPTDYCVYVGDATWNKNLVNLANAIKKINVPCIFVGKVFDNSKVAINNLNYHIWQKELKQFLEMTKNDKRFIFPGFISDSDLIQLYLHARCNILVSQDEGFGFSYLEASSQSCPSVLSDIPIFQEISNGSGVLFAQNNNPDSIADAIGQIYFNNEKRVNLGKNAKNRISFFDRKKFQKNWLDSINLN